MATKPNKVKFNLKNVHVAKVTKNSDGVYSYGTPRAVPGAVNLSMDAEGDARLHTASRYGFSTPFPCEGEGPD